MGRVVSRDNPVLVVEPGAFATAFGGAGMQRSRDSGVYTETVGPMRAAVDAR